MAQPHDEYFEPLRTFMVSPIGAHDQAESFKARSAYQSNLPYQLNSDDDHEASNLVPRLPLNAVSPRRTLRDPFSRPSDLPGRISSSVPLLEHSKSSMSSSAISPKLRRSPRAAAITFQEQQMQLYDIAIPPIALMRRMSEDHSNKRLNVTVKSPSEWIDRTVGPGAVRWADFSSPPSSHGASMIFSHRHLFNFELGSNIPHESNHWRLSFEAEELVNRFLADLKHSHYVMSTKELGPLVFSIEESSLNPYALIWSRNGIDLKLIPNYASPVRPRQLDWLMRQITIDSIHDDGMDVASYRRSSEPLLSSAQRKQLYYKVESGAVEFGRSLQSISNRLFSSTANIGILHCGPGQCFEDQLYTNDRISAAMLKFLSFLGGNSTQTLPEGGKVEMTAGPSRLTFHIAPLLPSSAQALLASCPVIIVFKEGKDDAFVPSMKIDRLTAVYIVVEPSQDDASYKIQLAAKLQVEPFPPYLPDPPLISQDEQGRELFLKKVAYAARAASCASRETLRNLEIHLQNAISPFLMSHQ